MQAGPFSRMMNVSGGVTLPQLMKTSQKSPEPPGAHSLVVTLTERLASESRELWGRGCHFLPSCL